MRGGVSEAEQGGGVSEGGVHEGELLRPASAAALPKSYLKAVSEEEV